MPSSCMSLHLLEEAILHKIMGLPITYNKAAMVPTMVPTIQPPLKPRTDISSVMHTNLWKWERRGSWSGSHKVLSNILLELLELNHGFLFCFRKNTLLTPSSVYLQWKWERRGSWSGSHKVLSNFLLELLELNHGFLFCFWKILCSLRHPSIYSNKSSSPQELPLYTTSYDIYNCSSW